jgi:tetratricopeptide (TPR) repeat protein
LNDFSGAIADYTNAIDIDPQNYYPYEGRADIKKEIKDYYGAISDYLKAIEVNSKTDDELNMAEYINENITKKIKQTQQILDNY